MVHKLGARIGVLARGTRRIDVPCHAVLLLIAQFVQQFQEFVWNFLRRVMFIDALEILVDLLFDGDPLAFLTPDIHFLVIPEILVRTLGNRYLSREVPFGTLNF
jgi:hypothetical protein